MPIIKRVRRDAPYLERSFNDQNSSMTGRSGVLFAGPIRFIDATHVAIPPYAFVQDGVVVINEDGHGSVVVPNVVPPPGVLDLPVFIVVGSPDITEASGITLAVTTDLSAVTGSAVVLATRYNTVWQVPPRISTEGFATDVRAIDRLEGAGVLEGLQGRIFVGPGLDNVEAVIVKVGKALNARGELLDAGVRSPAPPPPVLPDDHAGAAVLHPDSFWPRTDYFVARAPDAFPGPNSGVLPIVGGTIARSSAASQPLLPLGATGTEVSRPAFAFRGDAINSVCFHAWTDANNLLYSLTRYTTTGEAVVANGTILSTAASFTGERDVFVLFDGVTGHFLVFYVDPDGPVGQPERLMLVAVTPGPGLATAAVINDGPVLLSTSAVRKFTREPRAVLDSENRVHVVAQSDDGVGGSQIYYWRLVVATGPTFGTFLSGTPRIVSGVDDGDYDDGATIAIDRRDNLFVAYRQAVFPALAASEIILVRMNRLGDPAIPEVISTFVNSNVGASAADPYSTEIAVSKATTPRVIVTPQDELYVAFLGNVSPAPTVDHIYLYSPAFRGRIANSVGTGIAKAIDLFTPPTPGGIEWNKLELLTDLIGTIRVLAMSFALTVTSHKRYDTIVAPAKVLAPSILDSLFVTHRTGSFYAATMPTGSVKVTGHRTGINVTSETLAAGTRGTFTPHPTDVFLAAWSVPRNGDPNPLTASSSSGVHIERARPVRHKTPILVGRDGDYIGFDSLNQAIEASLGTGQQIRLQPGVHKLFVPPGGTYFGGLDVVGAPGALINAEYKDAARFFIFGGKGSVTLIDQPGTPGVVTIVSGTSGVFPGDVLEDSTAALPGTSPIYRHIVEVLDASRVRLFPSVATGGGAWKHLCGGVRFRNCRFVATNTTGVLPFVLLFSDLWEPDLSELYLENGALWLIAGRGGSVEKNDVIAGSLYVANSDRTSISYNVSRAATAGLGAEAGMVFTVNRRITVHGNRSYDNEVSLPDYKTTSNADLVGWTDNHDSGKSNAYSSDDPGQLVSRDVVLRARNSVITKDLLAQRINQGAYDIKIAILASEIDTLKNQDILELAFGATVYFDTAGLLV